MRNWKKMFTVFSCLLVLAIGTNHSMAADGDKASSAHKKSHKWLIPVMAAGGFAAGTFIGLSAYDDAINSDSKVWTTAALFGVAGGFAGWWTARKIDQDFRAPGLGQIKPETRKPVPAIARSTGDHKKRSILSDTDRIYPSYLSPSTVEVKKMAANANNEYSVKNKMSCSR